MIDRKLSQQLNSIFKAKRDKDYADQKARFNSAAANPNFSMLYSRMRALQSQVDKCKAMNLPLKNEISELEDITKLYNKFLQDNNIDLEMHYECEHCKDTGFVDNKECSCYKRARIALLKQACALSPMPNFTFDDNKVDKLDIPQKKVMQNIFKNMKSFCDNFFTAKLSTLYLGGEVGVGKTFLASCVANELLEKGIDVNYVTAFDFFRIIQAKQFNTDSNLASFYYNLLNSQLLIIDDLGTEPIYKNLSLEYFLSIIEYRDTHKNKTIFISNLNPNTTFKERYGERISSRIFDADKSMVQFIKGADLRKIK